MNRSLLLLVGLAGWLQAQTNSLEPAAPAPKPAPGQPADRSTLLHPEQLHTLIEAQGALESVDVPGRAIVIKDTTGHLISLVVAPNTRILDGQNHLLKLADLKTGDRVRAYYSRTDNTVKQIDVLPSVADSILGK